jgi:hypothetical protein
MVGFPSTVKAAKSEAAAESVTTILPVPAAEVGSIAKSATTLPSELIVQVLAKNVNGMMLSVTVQAPGVKSPPTILTLKFGPAVPYPRGPCIGPALMGAVPEPNEGSSDIDGMFTIWNLAVAEKPPAETPIV